ncbi:hypothetical protein E3N88_38566 [Mikania micrantha]|uniref:Ubiquitin-like protease family profile domain-containing protein n=1 Tax=Mikania micrantha TaxID=192012 RepID=A0A5N6LUE4_9ASTR|nr:hypothetical protein E3N88_38566 [Mikania micrantha]
MQCPSHRSKSFKVTKYQMSSELRISNRIAKSKKFTFSNTTEQPIYINESGAELVTGIPKEGLNLILIKQVRELSGYVATWMDLYQSDLVVASEIVARIMSSKDENVLFEIDFIVLFLTTIVECTVTGKWINIDTKQMHVEFWTTQMLKIRERLEIENGGFGLVELRTIDRSRGECFEVINIMDNFAPSKVVGITERNPEKDERSQRTWILDEENASIPTFNLGPTQEKEKKGKTKTPKIDDLIDARFSLGFTQETQKKKQIFKEYLEHVHHPKLSELKTQVPVKLKLPWEIKKNVTHCGVFVMSHMEMYMGKGAKNFDCGFSKNHFKRASQIKTLRKKYATRILLSDANNFKHVVIERAFDVS